MSAAAPSGELLVDALLGEQQAPSVKRPRSDTNEGDDDESLITRIMGKSLPSKVMQEIKEVVKKFSVLINKLSHATSRLQKMKKDRDALAASTYLAGVRPFAASTEAGYDEPLKAAVEEDCTWTVTIPKNSSRKDAARIVHLAAAQFQKTVEVEVLEDHVQSLKKAMDYTAFSLEAMAPATKHHTLVQSLGISLPPGLQAPVAISKEKATELYIAMVNRLAMEKAAAEEKQAKEKKEQDKLKEAVRNAHPKDLFDRAVRQAMAESSAKDMDHRVDYVKAHIESKAVEECIDFDQKPKPKPQAKPKAQPNRNGEPSHKRRFTKKELAARKEQRPNMGSQLRSSGEPKAPTNYSDLTDKGKGKGNGKNKGNLKGKGKNKGEVKGTTQQSGTKGKGKGYDSSSKNSVKGGGYRTNPGKKGW